MTSHSSSTIQVEEIELSSSSQAVELVKSPTQRILIHANEKFVQIGSFIVRSARYPSIKNNISIKMHYKIINSTQTGQAQRVFSYSELYDIITLNNNRFYEVSALKNTELN